MELNSIELQQQENPSIVDLASCTYAISSFELPSTTEARCWSPQFEPVRDEPVEFDPEPPALSFNSFSPSEEVHSRDFEAEDQFQTTSKAVLQDLFRFGFINESTYQTQLAKFPTDPDETPEPIEQPTVVVDILENINDQPETEPELDPLSLRLETQDIIGTPVFVFTSMKGNAKYQIITQLPEKMPWIPPTSLVYRGILGSCVDIQFQSMNHNRVIHQHKLLLQKTFQTHINCTTTGTTVSCVDSSTLHVVLEKIWLLGRLYGTNAEYVTDKPLELLIHCYPESLQQISRVSQTKIHPKTNESQPHSNFYRYSRTNQQNQTCLLISGRPTHISVAESLLSQFFAKMGSQTVGFDDFYEQATMDLSDLFKSFNELRDKGISSTTHFARSPTGIQPVNHSWSFMDKHRDTVQRECQIWIDLNKLDRHWSYDWCTWYGHPQNTEKGLKQMCSIFQNQFTQRTNFDEIGTTILKPRFKAIGERCGCKATWVTRGQNELVLIGNIPSIIAFWETMLKLLSQHTVQEISIPSLLVAKSFVGNQGSALKEFQATVPGVSVFVDFKTLKIVLSGKAEECNATNNLIQEKINQILIDQEAANRALEKERSKGFFGKGGKQTVTTKAGRSRGKPVAATRQMPRTRQG